jgi:hypothetical protein
MSWAMIGCDWMIIGCDWAIEWQQMNCGVWPYCSTGFGIIEQMVDVIREMSALDHIRNRCLSFICSISNREVFL